MSSDMLLPHSLSMPSFSFFLSWLRKREWYPSSYVFQDVCVASQMEIPCSQPASPKKQKQKSPSCLDVPDHTHIIYIWPARRKIGGVSVNQKMGLDIHLSTLFYTEFRGISVQKRRKCRISLWLMISGLCGCEAGMVKHTDWGFGNTW